MTRYIVTVFPPIFVGVEAEDEEMAKGIAADKWSEQRVFGYLENGIDQTEFYIGDVDLFDSDDTSVEIDLSDGSGA
ncbi:MAG TPA: hypothetical protein VN756_03140 [Solirubrobacterales bacterium]|nr:hypothetical protein [Solirubrobacterales bacterium]